MDKTIVTIVLFPIIALLMIFMVEYSIHTIYFNKISTVSEFAVKTIENEGELNSVVVDKIKYRMKQEGLDDTKFSLELIGNEKLNYNDPFEVSITGSYEYRALNMLGTGLGSVETTLLSKRIGYSNVWHR